MNYNNIFCGIFINRHNRFIAEVEVDGQVECCHIKNTGRCTGLLVPGAKVYICQADKPGRVTKYDLIAVWKGGQLVNVDSQAPNQVFFEYLQAGKYIGDVDFVKREAKYRGSRFDFYVEAADRRMFIEVKGVTLEKDGVALFPDAPTKRGVKHLDELVKCIKEGYETHVVFIIKIKGICRFEPNYEIHPEFAAALTRAWEAGVRVSALDCVVVPDGLKIDGEVPVVLSR